MNSLLIIQGSFGQRQGVAKDLAEKDLGQKITALDQHPDLFYFPAHNGGKSLGIGAIRDLIKRLARTTTQAKNKVALIEEAQRMTTEAQNALLKTLEEPPPHSVVILTAPKAEMLLPTIVSRCQISRLPPTIDLPQADPEYQEALRAWPKVLRQNRGERLAWVEENKSRYTDGDKVQLWLEVWISILRDLYLWQNQARQGLVNQKLVASFPPLVLTTPDIHTLLEEAMRARRRLTTTKVNPRLLWENMLLQLPVVE